MNYKEVIEGYVEKHGDAFKQIALDIHANPEVSDFEFFACEILSNALTERGFTVTGDAAGHRTGFDARYSSGKPGPVVAFLAEYDALEGIGHACGHNLFGAMSALAGCAFKQVVDELGGEVRVYGTPGEEGGQNGSAKGSFADKGYFDDVDFAMGVHPGEKDVLTGTSLANACVKIEFTGKPAHAAACPQDGINALDAVLQVYHSINAMRQHVTPDVRIHGIITHGGDAPNIVPEFAACYFFLRAATKPTALNLYARAEKIMEAAALATGATGKIYLSQNFVDNTLTTPSFDAVYKKNLEAYGRTVAPSRGGMGSTDVGNVSHVCPTIHPSISIGDGSRIVGHSAEMREASKTPRALDTILLAAKVMSMTSLDLFLDPDLLASVKAEHKALLDAEMGTA